MKYWRSISATVLVLLGTSCSAASTPQPGPLQSPSAINTLAPTRPSSGTSTAGPAELIWTSSSWAAMPWPIDVAVSQDGRVYVRDVNQARITAFDPEGNIVGGWGGDGTGEGQFEFRDPDDEHVASFGGMAILGDTVFVADKSRVQSFDLDGRYLGAWGERGRKPGQFLKVFHLAASPGGHLYLVDQALKVVQVYTPSGRLIRSWPLPKKNIRYPSALCVTPQDEVVIVDMKGTYRDERPNVLIHKFSPTGSLMKTWGEFDDEDGEFDPGEFASDASGAACSADGRIYVTDDPGKRVQAFDTDGGFLFSFEGAPGSEPTGAVAVNGSDIFATDYHAGTVSMFRLSR